MNPPKPMLACKFEETRVVNQLPVFVQPKLDGIRCLVHEGFGFSRSGKPLPNQHIQDWIYANKDILDGCDGELIVGDPTAEDVFNKTTSGVMSRGGEPDFRYHIFDIWNLGRTFTERLENLNRVFRPRYNASSERIAFSVPTRMSYTMESIEAYEIDYTKVGYEGIILRGPNTMYKQNRATPAQGQLIKVKRMALDEALIVGVAELMHNANELERDAFGYAGRSVRKDGMVPMETLGALKCQLTLQEARRIGLPVPSNAAVIEFSIGTGFNVTERQELWDEQERIIGHYARFKHFLTGALDAPRFPVFKGIRDKDDMDAQPPKI